MVAAELGKFTEGLRVLASVFRTELSQLVIEAYWQVLEEIELRHVGVGMRRALKESRFMPPPAELLAFGRHAKATAEPTRAELRSDRLLGEVERKAVRESWGNREKRTNGQMLEGCYLNLQAAKKLLTELYELDRDLPIGDVGRNGNGGMPSLLRRIAVARADVEHWGGYVVFWRGRCVEEGDDQVAGGRLNGPASRHAELSDYVRRHMNDPAFFGQEAQPGGESASIPQSDPKGVE
jgi:hypothetical protein